MCGVEGLVVVDAQVVAEPDDGDAAEGGGAGGVGGAVGEEGVRGVEGVVGDGGLEGEFVGVGGGERKWGGGGGEREVGEGRGLGWDFELIGVLGRG